MQNNNKGIAAFSGRAIGKFLTIPSMVLISLTSSCGKNLITPTSEISSGTKDTLVVNKQPVKDTLVVVKQQPAKVAYTNAGVYFIRKELSDINYTKRAATMIPSIEMGTNGELYSVWSANKSTKSNDGEGSGAYATVSISTDKGETWTDNELIVAPIDTTDRIFDQVLWKDPGGVVHLNWNVSKKSWWDGKGAVWECTLTYTNGGIRTSEPRLFMSSGVISNKPIQLKNTETMLYAQYIYNYFPTVSTVAGAYVYTGGYSQSSTGISIPTNTGKIPFPSDNFGTSFFEPQFLEMGDGTVACFIRTQSGGAFVSKASISSGLKDWSSFTKLTAIGDNPGMRFCVRRLSSGNILFVTCNDKTIRKNMTAYLSTDNGVTYPYKLLLDPRSNISYPDFTQDSNGTIFIVYDRGRTIEQEILMTKIKEADIISGNKSAVILKKVNHF